MGKEMWMGNESGVGWHGDTGVPWCIGLSCTGGDVRGVFGNCCYRISYIVVVVTWRGRDLTYVVCARSH